MFYIQHTCHLLVVFIAKQHCLSMRQPELSTERNHDRQQLRALDNICLSGRDKPPKAAGVMAMRMGGIRRCGRRVWLCLADAQWLWPGVGTNQSWPKSTGLIPGGFCHEEALLSKAPPDGSRNTLRRGNPPRGILGEELGGEGLMCVWMCVWMCVCWWKPMTYVNLQEFPSRDLRMD